jgi:hypothetical protein
VTSSARFRWIAPVVEIVIGLVVGYATWRLTDADNAVTGLLSIAIGLLATLVVASINRHVANEYRAHALDSQIGLLLARLGDRMDQVAEMASHLRHGPIAVPRERTSKAWLDLLWGCSSRYWGTVYTVPEEVVETSLFDLGHSVLSSKVRVDQIDARRVFIIDDPAELEVMRVRLQSQVTAGIQVRWINRKALETHPFLRDQIGSWSTLDVCLVDSRIVWLLHLDERRRIASGTLQIDPEEARRFEQIYRLLWDAAKPVSLHASHQAV